MAGVLLDGKANPDLTGRDGTAPIEDASEKGFESIVRMLLDHGAKPNTKDDLSRLRLRYEHWDPAFLAYCGQLEKSKPVVFCGDLNVAHTELDLTHPKANRGKKGFTDEERKGFQNILDAGFVGIARRTLGMARRNRHRCGDEECGQDQWRFSHSQNLATDHGSGRAFPSASSPGE